MAKIVLVYGKSGSGKSTSLRNFKPEEISVFSVAGKDLPFRGGNKIPTCNNATYADIAQGLANPTKKCYVIDDCGYLMTFAALRRATEKGFEKWNELSFDFFQMIDFLINKVPNDVIVYFMMHEDVDANGQVCAKTCGKVIRDTLALEGLFETVIRSVHDDTGYKFILKDEVNTITKTPMDMFSETSCDNDLKAIDAVIRDFYGMPPLDSVKPATKTKEDKK